MPQQITPKLSEKPHPNLSAPPGTKMYDPATLDDGRGGCFVAYGIQHGPLAPSGSREPGRFRVRYVPAHVAAVDLAWMPPDRNREPCHLATDEEIAQYHREGGQP
jgi:hypothetical protein